MPQFPITGFPNSVNRNIRYIHPSGDDSASGTTWQQPLRYLTTAWNQLAAIGGGTIEIADQSSIAPPGWPRSGAFISADYLTVPGSLRPVPMLLKGVPTSTAITNRGFGFGPAVTLNGGATAPSSSEQDDPAFWLAGPSNSAPIRLENIRFSVGINKACRIAWDYARRNNDGSIEKHNVTHASRASGRSVFTIAPYNFNIISIARVGGDVHVQCDFGGHIGCINPGMSVFVDYTGTHFTPATFVVTSVFGTSNAADTLVVTSAGTVFSDSSPTGTANSHCLAPSDYLTLYSTNAQWPSSPYRVVAITQTTVTTEDLYGFDTRSPTVAADNIGTYATQDRRGHGWDRFSFYNVGGNPTRDSEPAVDRFCAGPACDMAAVQFFTCDNTFFDGYNLDSVGGEYSVRNKERRAAILIDPGSLGTFGSGEFNWQYGGGGGFVIHASPSNSSGIVINHVLNDGNANQKPTPAIDVYGAGLFSQYKFSDVVLADNSGACPALRTDTNILYWNAINVENVFGTIEGPCNLIMSSAPNAVIGGTPPNVTSRTGWFGGDRTIAGRHLAAMRSGSTLTPPCSIVNSQDPTAWAALSTAGTVFTQGIRDPNGGTGAVRISNPTGSAVLVQFMSGLVTGVVPSNGDFAAATMWLRSTSDVLVKGGNNAFGMNVQSSADQTVFLDAQAIYQFNENEAEWICPSVGGQLTNVAGPGVVVVFSTQISAGGSVDVFLPSVFYHVATPDLSPTECAEIVTHLQPMPAYLASGVSGSRPGQKLIGHGGFGTNSTNKKTVGVGSGQLTLTGSGTVYLPMYDLNGTTIIGWVAQLQATVNP